MRYQQRHFLLFIGMGVLLACLSWVPVHAEQMSIMATEQETQETIYSAVEHQVIQEQNAAAQRIASSSFSESVQGLARDRTLGTLVQRFAPEKPEIFMPMVPLTQAHGGLAWTHFFSSALRFDACLNTPKAYAGFYNPVSDIFVIMAYRLNISTDDPSFLQQIEILRGEVLRGEPLEADASKQKMPPWFLAEGSKSKAMREKTIAAMNAFNEFYQSRCGQDIPLFADDKTAVEARLSQMISSVRDLKHGSALALSGHEAIVQLMNFGNVKPYQTLTTKAVKDPLILAYRLKKPAARVDLASAFLPAMADEAKEPSFMVHYELEQPGSYLISRFWYDAVTQQKYMQTERVRLLP